MNLSFRRISGLATLALGIALCATTVPASAQPFLGGSQATILVGSGVAVSCPPGSPGAQAGGTATSGPFFVGGPAGAQCTPTAARAAGVYSVSGSAQLPFEATCDANTGATGGGVWVPGGTTLHPGTPGATTVAGPTLITTTTTVLYPNGSTAVLNQVTTSPGVSVTRSAIVVTGGPGAGTVIGRVTCGAAPYPLAAEETAAASTGVDLTSATTGGNGGPGVGFMLGAGALAIALLLQVVVMRRLRARRAADIG